MLLSAAGVLTAALQNLENQSFGFEQDAAPGGGYESQAWRLPCWAALASVQAHPRFGIRIPGVSSVALCLYSPPRGGWGSGVWVDGQLAQDPRQDNSSAWNRVTPEYFEAIGTPILKGRAISAQDTATSRKVAVVSETFARKFFGDDDPIGKHFGRKPEATREFEIVGVARDARYFTRSLDRPSDPLFFLPEAQAEYAQTNLGSLFLRDIVIATRPGTSVPVASIRQAVAAVDPGIPITSIQTLRERVSSQFTQPRLIARLTSFFGALSLVLASIGLYGVISHNAATPDERDWRANGVGRQSRPRGPARTARRIRADSRRAVDRVAVDIRDGPIPRQSTLWD